MLEQVLKEIEGLRILGERERRYTNKATQTTQAGRRKGVGACFERFEGVAAQETSPCFARTRPTRAERAGHNRLAQRQEEEAHSHANSSGPPPHSLRISTLATSGTSHARKHVSLPDFHEQWQDGNRPLSKSAAETGTFRQWGFESGPRKLVVKNLRTRTSSDSEGYSRRSLADLDAALTAIFAKQTPALSNEELYRESENLCKLGKAQELAVKLFQRCEEHVNTSILQPLLGKVQGSDMEVLDSVLDAWSIWQKQSITIRSIFFYLDRAYLLQAQKPSIKERTVGQFRSQVFQHASLQGRCISGACQLLQTTRDGDAAAATIFTKAVSMLHDLTVYTSDFEPRMLEKSQTFIQEWSESECRQRKLPDYVARSVELIDAEMKRFNEDALADLLDENKVKDIAQLFALLQRRRLGEKLQEPFTKWVEDTGTAIIFDEKNEDKMVIRLLGPSAKIGPHLAIRIRHKCPTWSGAQKCILSIYKQDEQESNDDMGHR
ncbi:hypothetical protein MRB53_040881 [Persea americana]|nr:hypothetical protein MRB53_040881 [Persea americana]